MGETRGRYNPVIPDLTPRETEFQERQPMCSVVSKKFFLGSDQSHAKRREETELVILGKTLGPVVPKAGFCEIPISKTVSTTHGQSHVSIRNAIKHA